MERLEVEIVTGIAGFEKALNQAQSKLKKFGEAAEQLGTTLSKSLTLPIVAFGAAAVKSFGDIQALKNGLTAVTGSAEEAEKQFIRLQEVAKLPGLGLNEAVKGAINLQTVGFSADKAEKSMMAFGNAVATVGKGRAEFERAIYGLQQLANTDFPLGEDLNIIKDAIPQVVPLLKEAFGSTRSDELKTLGITSAQVIDTIVEGLGKLPKVTGGINGAFENLADGVKNNLAELGESINEAFDISAIIDSLVENFTKVTKAFKELSPQTQKIIFIITGLVAALGPLLLVIGTVTTTVIPALTAGLTVLGTAFTALTGPIGLIVLAIAGAVYLIIKYWDEIVAYFTTGPGKEVFDSLSDAFSSVIQFIQDLWKTFIGFLTDFWDEWGSTILASAKFYFGLLSKYFKIVFDIISSIFKAGSAILSGDWAALGDILLTTTKKIWNSILGIIIDVVKAGTALMGKFFEFIGFDNFGKKLVSLNNVIADFVKKKFSFDIPVTLDIKDTKNPVATATAAAKKEAAAGVKILSETANKVSEIFDSLNKDLLKNTIQLGFDKDDILEADIKSYQQAINKLIEAGLKPWSAQVKELIARQKELLTTGRNLNILPQLSGPQLKVNTAIVPEATIKFKKVEVALSDQIAKWKKQLENFNTDASNIISTGIADAFAMVGETIGKAFAGGTDIISNLANGLLSIVGSVATELGKAAIAIGVGMLAIKAAFKNPFTAIAAGVALIALGSFISNKVANIPKGENGPGGSPRRFANGGIISGPTYGLMGEYAGAKNNPEVVAPLNKLKGMLGGVNDGVEVFIPEVRLGNDAIYIAYKRGEKQQNRI